VAEVMQLLTGYSYNTKKEKQMRRDPMLETRSQITLDRVGLDMTEELKLKPAAYNKLSLELLLIHIHARTETLQGVCQILQQNPKITAFKNTITDRLQNKHTAQHSHNTRQGSVRSHPEPLVFPLSL
jgi:hypothetical protein